ncbi:NEDD8 protease Nep2 [Chamberlinius hualienensis]
MEKGCPYELKDGVSPANQVSLQTQQQGQLTGQGQPSGGADATIKFNRKPSNTSSSMMLAPTTANQENHVHIKKGKHWIRRRTALERILLAITLALFLSLIIVLIIVIAGRKLASYDTQICSSPACIHAASQIYKKLDMSVHPCQDFYRFACGSFLANNVVPDDEIMKSTLQIIQEEIYTIVKRLIENFSPNDTAPIIKAKKLYNSCLSENWTAEEDDRSVIASFLESVNLKPWPIMMAQKLNDNLTWNETQFNLEETLAILTIYQVQPFIDTFVSTDDKNSSVYVLQLYRGGPVLERDFYLNDSHPLYRKYMGHYLKLMKGTAKLLGVPQPVAKDELYQIIEFEKKLANLTHNKWHKNEGPGWGNNSTNDTSEDDNYHKITLNDLGMQIPQLDWSYFLDYVFTDLNLPIEGPTLPLIIHSRNYLTNLVSMLGNTPKRTIANYLTWRFIFKYMPYLNRRFSRLYADFRREVPDPNESSRTYFSRWKECVAITNEGFGMVLGSLYANSHFDEDMEKEVRDLVKDLKAAFVEILPNQKWMDDETKEACKKKLAAMGEKIGYPKYILDPKMLFDEYDGLEVQEGHLLSNMLRIKRFEVQKELKKLQRPVNKEKDWYGSPLDVNAFYRPNFNEIVFPAGILRFPFYSPGLPSYLKLGSIGVVIGHEITHGFDNYGRKYDKNGNHTSWWPDDAVEKFNKEATCFAEQYAKYKMDLIGENVNGNDTLGDNICDNAGLKHAYVAYQKWKKTYGAAPRLPGIEFSDEQLFFIQYGQIWCEVVSKEGYIKYTKDAHSPGKYRTIGALSNSPEFARTFQCPPGSAMNPRKKCRLWV